MKHETQRPASSALPERSVKQVGIRVPARVMAQLEMLAKRESNGVSAVCRRFIADGLAAEERRSVQGREQ